MTKTVVVKIGTSSICNEHTQQPRISILASLVESIAAMKKQGYKVVLVTSGAIGMGMRTIGMRKRPNSLAPKQALAAIGQGRLMSMYDNLFSMFDMRIAQVLLTRPDIAERSRYLNACNTFRELLSMDIVPIVNENDTVSVAEIRFGDNDTLSAITAGMVKADFLFLLTDVECLYTDNPRKNPQAQPIFTVRDIEELMKQIDTSSAGSAYGTGGMSTKLVAANLAVSSGIPCIITSSLKTGHLLKIIETIQQSQNDDSKGPSEQFKFTYFVPKERTLVDRKWWMMYALQSAGTVTVDPGASAAISNKTQTASLFAVGIIGVEGEFSAQEAVRVKSADGKYLGIGLVNYSSAEIEKIKGRRTSEIPQLLGDYSNADCVIDRYNLALN